MLFTDRISLKKFSPDKRLWQGIPSIEVTSGGRIFLTYYSGGTKEEIGNFCILSKSDNGEHFEDVAITYLDDHRCYDPCIWIDPLGRLWFTWGVAPDHAVWASICDDPDAEELIWSEPCIIGHEVMMNKPTVLSSGEWLFPIAVWELMENAGGTNGVADASGKQSKQSERLAFVYKTDDNGETFQRLGGCSVPKRSFDEHMVIERKDGRLAMYVRTKYGIGISYSDDKGHTWSLGEDSGLGGPCSRFFIRRLKSGRMLLINHYNYTGRSHLTAMLSEDDGKTWPYKLLLDERANVSYPDATEHDDGYIYITYDRERGGFLNSLERVYASAREVLIAKITEEDIISGRPLTQGSYLKRIAAKLGKYAFEESNPYKEFLKFSDEELASLLADQSTDKITAVLFEHYGVNCINLHTVGIKRLDSLIDLLKSEDGRKKSTILDMIKLLRGVTVYNTKVPPIIDRAKSIIEDSISEDITVAEIAEKLNMSVHYLCHAFKAETGITPIDYRNSVKLIKARGMLVGTEKKVSEIAFECGFGSASYFSKIFSKNEGITPLEYRRQNKA